jgi:hypothetical protein
MNEDLVRDKIDFARRRMKELLALNGGDLLGASAPGRDQLLMEFFFHVVGAVDILAQFVNERRGLGISSEDVHVRSVVAALPPGDVVGSKLNALYQSPKQPFPSDPYNEEGYIYRLYNYRHQVTHRGTNPFLMQLGAGLRRATLYLDPRDMSRGYSSKDVQEDMENMIKLAEAACRQIISLL